VPTCSTDFLRDTNRTFLLTNQIRKNIYKDKVELIAPPNHTIVIDNTLFPNSMVGDSFFFGAYQPLPINIDISVISSYDLLTTSYYGYVTCKYFQNMRIFLFLFFSYSFI